MQVLRPTLAAPIAAATPTATGAHDSETPARDSPPDPGGGRTARRGFR